MDKISDFKELKALKKKLASTEEKAEGAEEKQPSRRDRTVRNKSRAEHKAAEDGICLGMRVKLMDSNDYAVVKAFSDKGYCIECNGIEFMAQRSEFVLKHGTLQVSRGGTPVFQRASPQDPGKAGKG